jgi:hypothetical protein
MTPQPSNWRHLAEQARNEMDPEKMLALVTELNSRIVRGARTNVLPETIPALKHPERSPSTQPDLPARSMRDEHYRRPPGDVFSGTYI